MAACCPKPKWITALFVSLHPSQSSSAPGRTLTSIIKSSSTKASNLLNQFTDQLQVAELHSGGARVDLPRRPPSSNHPIQDLVLSSIGQQNAIQQRQKPKQGEPWSYLEGEVPDLRSDYLEVIILEQTSWHIVDVMAHKLVLANLSFR
jgi:hypothetical protein